MIIIIVIRKDMKMNKEIDYVKRMRCVEFQMGFEPTTFCIGPRNIYTRETRHKVGFFNSILCLLFLEMLVEQESFLW